MLLQLSYLGKMASIEKSGKGKELSSNYFPSNSSSSRPPMKITVLVVDDDSTSLAIVAAMLREWRYEVACASSAMDALTTLRARPDDIDLVVTDLHMPEMDGIELQTQIKKEFKQLPVIIMSSDDQESAILRSLAAGAVFYMVKPINPEDLKNVWQYAIAAKKGKTVAYDHDEEETGSIGQGSDSSSAEKLSRNQMKSADSVNDDDNKKKNDNAKRGTKRSRKGRDDDDDDEDETASAPKKAKVVWTNQLHNQFLDALRHIGMDKAVPKKILEHMNVPGLTRENVASHLQKYRMFLKRVAERSSFTSKAFVERILKSSFASGHPTLLKTAQEYSRMAELQRLRGLSFHPGYGGTTVPAHHFNTDSHRSILFPNHNNIASSSNSALPHQYGYGQSRLLGNQAAHNYKLAASGHSNPLYQGNRFGFANGSNFSSLNGGFSGGLINARNGLMTGANPMQTYQQQIQRRPNFYTDAGASSSQFVFGSSGFHSSNSNLGTGTIGTIGTSYPALNSSCIGNNSYPGFRLPTADEQLFGMGQLRLNDGGCGSMNGPFNDNVNVAATGNQAFHHMAQGAGSYSQRSYSPNQVSPAAYTAANQQANTSPLTGFGNNGGESHHNSVHLMNNGGGSQYNTVNLMNHASTVDNITPPQQLGDGYLSDLFLESRNYRFSNQLQASGDGVRSPDLPGSPLFPEIYPSLEDLLNIDFAESLSLEETTPRARREQAPAQMQSVNEEVTEMDMSVDGTAYYPTTNFYQSTNQQQSGEQLADHSELNNIFQADNASVSASASGNEPSNTKSQNWGEGDDFVNSLFSFDPHFE